MTSPGRYLFLLLLGLVALPPDAAADRLPVRTYSTAEGLAHFVVNRVVRDSRGFLWFCTRDGLSMFDGYGFTTYRREDGLPSANISDILETPDGLFWIGTREGLVLFDPSAPPGPSTGGRRARFTVIPAPGDSRAAAIRKLVRDHSGTVWVGTNAGLFRAAMQDERISLIPVDLGIVDELNARQVQSLMVDRQGTLWIAANPGIFVRARNGSIARLTIPGELPFDTAVIEIAEDRRGRVWAATTRGLWQIRLERDGRPGFVRGYGAEEGLTGWVLSIFESTDGSLWVGTLAELFKVESGEDPLNVRFTPVGAGQTSSIAEDLSGNLWVGTPSGVRRYVRTGITVTDDVGLVQATALARTADGSIAVMASRGGGHWAIYCSDGEAPLKEVRPGGALGTRTWAWNQVVFQDSRGDWWIGSARGAFRFGGAASCRDLEGRQPQLHFDSTTGLAANVVIRMFEDSRGDVWIATVGHGVRPDGLSRWRRGSGTMQRFGASDGLALFERHFVTAFAEDRAGNVWIGFSGDAGLARFRHGRFERFTKSDGVPTDQIRNMTIDSSGRLWIASFKGLCRIDDPTAQMPQFRAYSKSDGLAANEAHTVVADASGRVYIGSAQGIDRLDPATGLVKHYSHDDGVPEPETNGGAIDRDGVLWFTHVGGVTRLKPIDAPAGLRPRVLITALTMDGEPLPVSAIGEQHVARLELPFQHNSLHVRFVALGSQSGGNYRYRYHLENAKGAWSPFSELRDVNFANLAPGQYRLVVEAQDADGRSSESPATVAFTVVPPLWQRRGFVAAAVLAIVAAAYAFHRYRLRRVIEIARIRDRIAADLHDDLGANLTKIAVLGEVARQQTPRGAEALTSIAGIARESVANMSDIVWAIDPTFDTMEDLVRKMRQHASETFALGDVELTFHAPKDVDHRSLDLELRHDLFLLFKEAINNAARHSCCSRADVDLHINRRALRLRIADDGIGFGTEPSGNGHGTGSMRRRAARMGGSLSIESVQGQGTTVTFALPLS